MEWRVQVLVLDSHLNSRQGRVVSNENKSRFKKSLRTVGMTSGLREMYHQSSSSRTHSAEVLKLTLFLGLFWVTTTLQAPFPCLGNFLPFDPPSLAEARKCTLPYSRTTQLQAWNLARFPQSHTHVRWQTRNELRDKAGAAENPFYFISLTYCKGSSWNFIFHVQKTEVLASHVPREQWALQCLVSLEQLLGQSHNVVWVLVLTWPPNLALCSSKDSLSYLIFLKKCLFFCLN